MYLMPQYVTEQHYKMLNKPSYIVIQYWYEGFFFLEFCGFSLPVFFFFFTLGMQKKIMMMTCINTDSTNNNNNQALNMEDSHIIKL